MSFAAMICCMDGRVQLPVMEYLKQRFGADYIDNITNAGPVGILAREPGSESGKLIFRLVDISIQKHASTQVAIVAHHDCAGNPIPDGEQQRQLEQCRSLLIKRYPGLEIIVLWVDDTFKVLELPA
jgi:carbonic anhydrase